jgi:hypothetical protein
MTKQSLTFFAVAIIVSGCVSQETFVKNNMKYTDFEKDRASCETQASQQVEVNRSPGAELAVALFTGVYQVQDANAAARVRNYEACMMSRGYQRVALPACTKVQEAQRNGVGPLTAQNRVKITESSCFVSDQAGRIVFHNNTPS